MTTTSRPAISTVRSTRALVASVIPIYQSRRPRSAHELLAAKPMPDRALSWVVTLVVTGVAGFLRLWAVGFPGQKIFDEVYYPANANELLRQGYESNPGHLFVVHPPLGKWCIAAGIELFGDNSLGWRFPAAVAGTISVLILIRVTRRMTGSTLLGGIAGMLLALDGLSVVMSRTSLLDIFLQPFILGGFAALVVDRDQVRARLAEAVVDGPLGTRLGPRLGPRPWRLIAGVLLGASCSVKWSGVYFLAGFAVLSVLWDRDARRSAGVRRANSGAFLRDVPAAVVALVAVPIGTYLLTWTGWFLGSNGYDRHWADDHPGGRWSFLPSAVRSLLHYHQEMLKFHDGLSSYHPYRSQPWAWLIDARPVNFYYPKNVTGCGSESCVRQIVALGTPAIWWAFLPTVLWMLWLVFSRRDWRALVVLTAFAAGWGTWLINTDRTMFFFYMTPLVPFLIIGVVLVLGQILGAAAAGERRRTVGLIVLCVYLALVVINFAWLWPILSGQKISYSAWHARMWFSSWI
ncbi:MAG TPA: phospholipid carrier-dependent glycosyltransferase [Mycobacteriales bacterium]|nr:phospholipid carrier-dependent glycosyltransferase [Mycobacteriales bacterium]